jgi:MFS family permease
MMEGLARAGLGASLGKLPRGIWVLGFVSMLMDISSEMIHGLLPVYLVAVLGASTLTVGVIEGIAEATASVTKIFSGALSDWLGRRKELTALGYGLAAITKPVFPLASNIGLLVAARFIDRIGKGIRGAPRDALIADLAPESLRGASFGLRQSLDTVGAFVGPLLAIGLMMATAGSYATVFWVAVIPAFLAFALVLFGVQEPVRSKQSRGVAAPLSLAELSRLGGDYWRVVFIASVFTLARFSEAFLILRAQSAGLAPIYAPAVLVLMNIVYSAMAYPMGALSDRLDRNGLLTGGIALLVAADLVLALSSSLLGIGVGIVLWGLHLAATQGLLSRLIADSAPADLRGTAFGAFNLVTGLCLLPASLIAGGLWDRYGPQATFVVGAILAGVALSGFLWLNRRAT